MARRATSATLVEEGDAIRRARLGAERAAVADQRAPGGSGRRSEPAHPAKGKAGWTDVATFHELGIPATNFGAGDPLLAHRSDEFITLGELDAFAEVLRSWLA